MDVQPMKRRRNALASLAAAGFFAVIAIVETAAFAQKSSVPKKQNGPQLNADEVRQLMVLMDTNKDGKISKQEWMTFMAAEFDRLDKDHSGDLDAKDLEQSSLRASRPFSTAGK
jgi:hypothetical protein